MFFLLYDFFNCFSLYHISFSVENVFTLPSDADIQVDDKSIISKNVVSKIVVLFFIE